LTPTVSTSRTESTPETQATPPNTEEPKYPGITIDRRFPIISEYSSLDANKSDKTFGLDVLGYKVEVSNYAPKSIRKNSSVLLTFKVRSPKDYWSGLVGVSSLLGPGSKQIYFVATGPGGVCCTNYWIADVTSGTPQLIFRSEDHGYFRDPMEIFDYDRDGIYELVQFDSCFRYFMGDSGSGSPEPRAVFRYDKKLGRYVPAAGIMPDFVREELRNSDKDIREKAKLLKGSDDLGGQLDLYRAVLSHFVQLLHFGDEQEAWKFFKEYEPNPSKAMLKEIRKRLANCSFYQELRRRPKMHTKTS
jgi:hypothetical protein